jgi:ATPase family associated with various cellular activities (AAA)
MSAAPRRYDLRARTVDPSTYAMQQCVISLSPEEPSDESDREYDPDDISDQPRVSDGRKRARSQGGSRTRRNQELVITVAKVRPPVVPPSKRPSAPLMVHWSNSELAPVPFVIHTFEDLWRLSQQMQKLNVVYKDCQKLWDLHPLLSEIHAWIGLREVKDALCTFMLYELQVYSQSILARAPDTVSEDTGSVNAPRRRSVVSGSHTGNPLRSGYYRHMAITGPPGVGKSMIAHTIARILQVLNGCESDEVTYGSRRNMIADYVGQSKTLVQAVVNEALSKSGVLFVDEAPNLMDTTNTDSYGKEVIDTLMELMDEHREELVVILAGYRPEMEQHIFQVNKGLRRRIQWWFHIEGYTPSEMHAIFRRQMDETPYQLPLDGSIFTESWFGVHVSMFPYYGGSIRNLVEKVLYVQRKTTFGQENQAMIKEDTLNQALDLYRDFCLLHGSEDAMGEDEEEEAEEEEKETYESETPSPAVVWPTSTEPTGDPRCGHVCHSGSSHVGTLCHPQIGNMPPWIQSPSMSPWRISSCYPGTFVAPAHGSAHGSFQGSAHGSAAPVDTFFLDTSRARNMSTNRTPPDESVDPPASPPAESSEDLFS